MLAIAKLAASIGLIARVALAQEHGDDASREMGPVAFMWPPDRLWGADFDNHAPCGSAANVANRTIFPLRKFSIFIDAIWMFMLTFAVNGQISLVAQDESWQIQVAISHSSGMRRT